MKHLLPLLLIAALATTIAPTTRAENNIDLSTIQPREGVQLTIYNAEDLTLVRETRTVTFREGDNPLAVLVGQHADRSDVGRAAVPRPPRFAVARGHDLPPRQAAAARVARPERNHRPGHGGDQLLHLRRDVVGRLRRHRLARREPARTPRLRDREEPLRRGLRGRRGPPRRRHDQPRGKDRPARPAAVQARHETSRFGGGSRSRSRTRAPS